MSVPATAAPAGPSPVPGRNRLSALRFVLAMGVVASLGDVAYEGMRSVIGPFLATLGAGAALVGVISGAGEAIALVFRLGTGRLADRTHRRWGLAIGGYGLTALSVPLLALAGPLWSAALLVGSERFGKALRSPAKSAMLASAGKRLGRGWTFALHEAMDQTGAFVGPLLMAGMIALSGYRLGFAVLAAPGVAMAAVLVWLRRAVPEPDAYEAPPPGEAHAPGPAASEAHAPTPAAGALPGRFWLYAAFTALTLAGYATFAVLAYHLHVRHVVSDDQIPLVYAAAMAAGALAALVSGRLYDRIGLRGLVVLPLLATAVPFLSFSTTAVLVWVGAVIWGAAMGMHESTMQAAVADLAPAARRGSAYGSFTAVYGTAWLAGSAAIGALYGLSIEAATVFVVVIQALALIAFAPLLRPQPAPT